MTILEAVCWFAVILFLGGYALFLAHILFKVFETAVDVTEKVGQAAISVAAMDLRCRIHEKFAPKGEEKTESDWWKDQTDNNDNKRRWN